MISAASGQKFSLKRSATTCAPADHPASPSTGTAGAGRHAMKPAWRLACRAGLVRLPGSGRGFGVHPPCRRVDRRFDLLNALKHRGGPFLAGERAAADQQRGFNGA
jgi:hypothetical protein